MTGIHSTHTLGEQFSNW